MAQGISTSPENLEAKTDPEVAEQQSEYAENSESSFARDSG
jgi:hypothetical protein